jgi:hypothetical protein
MGGERQGGRGEGGGGGQGGRSKRKRHDERERERERETSSGISAHLGRAFGNMYPPPHMIHERGMMKQSRRERARLCVCVHMDSGYSKIYFKKKSFFFPRF